MVVTLRKDIGSNLFIRRLVSHDQLDMIADGLRQATEQRAKRDILSYGVARYTGVLSTHTLKRKQQFLQSLIFGEAGSPSQRIQHSKAPSTRLRGIDVLQLAPHLIPVAIL